MRPVPPAAARRAIAALISLALCATILTGIGPASSLSRPAAAAELWQLEMLAQLNAYRAIHGRAPVVMCANLNAVATAHSQDMANRQVLSHVGGDGSTFDQRIARSNYGYFSTAGENVAVGHTSVTQVMTGWRNSGGHNANLLHRDFRHVGFGRVVGHYGGHANMPYWTQNFAAGGNCTSPVSEANDPIGSLDSVSSPAKGKVRMVGWAMDRDAGTSAVRVRATVNGSPRDLGLASKRRDDLAGHGMGVNHGFDVTVSANPGSNHVCVHAVNVGGGSDVQLGCRTVWVADPASPFTDVLSTNPFFDAIVWMHDRGFTTGNADGTFGIVEPTSRQAMAAFLYRVAGSPAGPFPDPGFTDVGPRHPFRKEIAWMAHAGIAGGYADGSFGPTRTVSRQATVAFIHRMAGEPSVPSGAPAFRDVPSRHPFHKAIRWAAGTQVTTGWADGTFRPGSDVTRQAMAAFLYRWKT